MKAIIIFLSLCSTVLAGNPAPQYYLGKGNSVQMRAYQTAPGVTRYYAPTGQSLGSSYTYGGRTNYYNGNNTHIGSATQIQNGFRYFNSQGKGVGSVQSRR